jgi:hypothetical protein
MTEGMIKIRRSSIGKLRGVSPIHSEFRFGLFSILKRDMINSDTSKGLGCLCP